MIFPAQLLPRSGDFVIEHLNDSVENRRLLNTFSAGKNATGLESTRNRSDLFLGIIISSKPAPISRAYLTFPMSTSTLISKSLGSRRERRWES